GGFAAHPDAALPHRRGDGAAHQRGSPARQDGGGHRANRRRRAARPRHRRGRELARRVGGPVGARAGNPGDGDPGGRHDPHSRKGSGTMNAGLILLGAIALFVIVTIAKGIRIVQQAQTMVIERLGKYHRTLPSGINLVMPWIDKPRAIDWHQVVVTPAGDSFARHFRTDKIDLRETVYVFPRQNVITKDNVVVEIDALIYSQITDPVRATYEIANLPDAIEKLTQTTLRNVIGEMELDHVLSSRDTINAKLREILDEATHKWGSKVSRVELKDINPP